MNDCCDVPSTTVPGTGELPEAGCPAPEAASEPASRPRAIRCPACGARGRSVEVQTVKALLGVSLRRLRASAYRFCPTPHCAVVYFAVDGSEQYTEEELRERVHQKHPDDPQVFVCYCFRYTPGEIQAELATTGRSTVVEEIQAGIEEGQCACEIRNPQGSCCLGNVLAVVRRLQAASGVQAEPSSAPTSRPSPSRSLGRS